MKSTYDDRSSAAFFCGLLTGVALGAGAAILYAPKPGPEMRQDLVDGANELGQAARETWEDVTTTAAEAVQKGRAEYHRTRAALRR